MTSPELQHLLPGFTPQRIATSGTDIQVMVKGDGPPLLLLHGHPQTLACWHKLAPALAQRYTVVLTDLRGYGDSGKPEGGVDHIAYSKREMARDQVEVMRALGFDRFHAAGHDRGGRVLHRLLLDHPQAVDKGPRCWTSPPPATMYAQVSKQFATQYLWWFFLIQPAPLPETLIGNNPGFLLAAPHRQAEQDAGRDNPRGAGRIPPLLHGRDPCTPCARDYRAAAGIDLVHDEADKDRLIQSPLLLLWGDQGVVGKTWDVLATWRDKALAVQGASLPCGHYLPEEQPDALLARFTEFFV